MAHACQLAELAAKHGLNAATTVQIFVDAMNRYATNFTDDLHVP